MKTTLAPIAVVATLAQPAAAITFPSLTTIYVGSGVESFSTQNATIVHCSNVSGVTVSLRFLFLTHGGGEIAGTHTSVVSHGQTYRVSTRSTGFSEDFAFSPALSVSGGVVNIESTNSAVFCTAKVVDPEAVKPTGFALPLVRVNPHPGTVE
jgi:hypothetical protein